ncbi:unnamed protein product [Symbiodinium sp. CCMP2592]|nr:unnamed protein product [Symbiodinium sp. CCMP2592]
MPYLGLFGKTSPDLPRAQKQRLYLRRSVHIVVAALNFLHDCGRWAPGHLLWREPNAGHLACYRRIRSFVVACFSRKEEFPLPPGRSGPDLVARLLELESFAGSLGSLGSSCSADLLASHGPIPSVPPSADLPQLQPFRSLDVSRLKLHGTGAWPIASFLEGPLWLPFQEPLILRHGLPLGTYDLPDLQTEDANEHLKLALLWDARGLLRLVPPLPPEAALIGDRRPANRAEMHPTGPSRLLPQGSLLTAYQLPRRRSQLVAYISDRRDFYHQLEVTAARADCNRLPFGYEASAFEGTRALATWTEERLSQSRHTRAPARLVPAFASLLQGDHLGVEFALEGHSQLLSAYDALEPWTRLQGNSVLPQGEDWQALVIDDLVNLSAVPLGSDPAAPSHARLMHHRAAIAYCENQVQGSPDKDVEAATLFQAIGAEVDSQQPQVSRGCVPVGAPLGRRVALAVLSLRAARLPITSARLLSRLTGAWISCAMYRRCLTCIFRKTFGPELCLAAALSPMFATNLAVEQHEKVYATDAS